MPAARPCSAWIDIADYGKSVVLRICGELDGESRDVIAPMITAAVATAEVVVLNLGRLTFCDSSGLALLLRTVAHVQAAGKTVRVVEVPPNVRYVFTATGVEAALLGQS